MRSCLWWSLILTMVGSLASATASPIGIGAHAGLNIPMVQEDAGSGPLYGARLRITVTPFLALEPSLTFFKQGDAMAEVRDGEIKLDGGQSTALGMNLILGSVGLPSGLRVHGVMGMASHAVKQEGTEDQSRFAMSLGPGGEIEVAEKLALSVEARLHMISLEGGGARKNLSLSGGLMYYLSD